MMPLEMALALLLEGLWPIPVTAVDDAWALNPGKAPIGKGWGIEKHTDKSLRSIYARHTKANIGIKLGPEGGVVDIDVDDPILGRETIEALFAGEVPATRGWSSTRGHHWLFKWNIRLAAYGKAIIKIKGVEIRLGWSPENLQYQSVVPPSIGDNGQPRIWNEHTEICELPESFYLFLDDYFAAPTPTPGVSPTAWAASSPSVWGPEERAAAYLKKCQPAISGQRGHDQAFKVACKIGPGFDLSMTTTVKLISEIYNPTCEPPWTEKEIWHKIENAYDKEPRRGFLLNVDKPGHVRALVQAPRADDAEPGSMELLDDPFRLARRFLAESSIEDGTITLRYWLEEWHRWDGHRYRTVAFPEVKAALVDFIKLEFDQIGIAEGKPPRKLTTGIIANTVQALSSLSILYQAECPHQPSWLDFQSEDVPDPRDVVPAQNGLIHLPALIEGREGIIDPTPRFFSPNCLDYGFNIDAPRPDHWLSFLDSVWGDDPASIASLQEWFGYLLTPDTSQQKILILIGPTRSGKGTIARTLASMVGTLNVASPTLSGLANNFGLAPLIGKTLAIFADARLSGRSDSQVIVERLLSISGEDGQTIDRKHLSSWSGQLKTRFVLISNELPRLGDSSGAMTARTIILRMTQSFLGREDTELQGKITAELPSILLWAIAGWARLQTRRRFTQPPSGLELLEEMKNLSSPIGLFIDERCELAPDANISKKGLFDEWVAWCKEQGKDHPGDQAGFGRQLRAAIPTIKSVQARTNGKRNWEYFGIGLRPTY